MIIGTLALAFALGINTVTCVLWLRQPDDGFARLLSYMAAHVPTGANVTDAAIGQDGDIGQLALADSYDIGLWDRTGCPLSGACPIRPGAMGGSQRRLLIPQPISGSRSRRSWQAIAVIPRPHLQRPSALPIAAALGSRAHRQVENTISATAPLRRYDYPRHVRRLERAQLARWRVVT